MSKEAKVCLQQKRPDLQTPCYKIAGNKPCSAQDCAAATVFDRSQQREKDPEMRRLLSSQALHFYCRLSFFAKDSKEFKARVTSRK